MNPSLQTKSPGKATRLPIDVILFFALYIIAPSYLAVEFHHSLPLVTLSRALLVIMGLMLAFRRRQDLFKLQKPNWKALNLGLTDCKLLRWGLLAYFALLLLADIALFPADSGEALKAIFVLILEEYILLWLLTLILDTRKKLVGALQTLVIAAGCVALISIIGCIFSVNPFHWLDTVEREMLRTNYLRLGVLRAEAGFGHPVYYGAFCAMIVPINMYFVEHSEKRWMRVMFAVILSLNLVALLLSNSRGSLLAFGCTFVLIVFLKLVRREFKQFLRTYIPVMLLSAGILGILVAVLPHGLYFLTGTINSLLDAVIPEGLFKNNGNIPAPTETTSATKPIVEYGENADGARSRLAQLTGISYTFQRKPLFGLGSNAHTRGLVHYQFVEGQWWHVPTFDMGLVAIACQYGIAGLIGYGALFGTTFLTTLSKKFRKDSLMQQLSLSFVTYMLCLLTISSLPKMDWVLIAAIVCLVNIIKKESVTD